MPRSSRKGGIAPERHWSHGTRPNLLRLTTIHARSQDSLTQSRFKQTLVLARSVRFLHSFLICDFNLCILRSIFNYSFQFTSHILSVEDSRLPVESLYIFSLFYQRTLLYIFIMNPGIGSSIFLSKVIVNKTKPLF